MGKRSPMPWMYTTASYLALQICQSLFTKASYQLSDFVDRTIGIAVLHGIDISARVDIYIKLLVVFGITFFVGLFFSYYLWSFAKIRVSQEKLDCDSTHIFTLSLFSIFITIFHYLNGNQIFIEILGILKLLLVFSFIVLINKSIFAKRDKTLVKLLNNGDLIVLSFLFPAVVFFTRWVIVQGSFIFTSKYYLYYSGIWFLYWVVLRSIFFFKSNKDFNTTVVSILKGACSLILIPLSIIVSNEIQYSLSGITNLSVYTISISATLTFILSSILVFKLNHSNNLTFNFSKYIYFPVFLVTLTVIKFHSNFLEISAFDTFHHGENLLSTQQLFQFGKIPFVDIYPTHGFSYMVSQIAYSLVNGYRSFEPWLWEWTSKVFEILLLYIVITSIFNPFFSACLIAFMPIIGIFGGSAFVYGYNNSLPTTYYFTSFIVGLLLVHALRKTSYSSMVILGAACLFLLAWRIDFGIAGTMSAGLIILIVLFFKVYNRVERIKLCITISKSFITLIPILLVVLAFLFRFDLRDFLTKISLMFRFVQFQGQAQGLLLLATSLSPLSIFQYFILPFLGLIYILVFLVQLIFGKHHKIAEHKLLLTYLSLFSLIMFTRSFQRQTLAVLGLNPYLFSFLLLTLPAFLMKRESKFSQLLFVLFLLIYQVIFQSPHVLLKSGQLINLRNWKDKEPRVHADSSQYYKITEFLNLNLSKQQTFIDLSSSPLLFITTDKEFVGYFIPPAYYTSETIQSSLLKEIRASFDKNIIPIILLKQPVAEANYIDMVPNEIRSYKIYEFVYENYTPKGFVDGYMVWIKDDFKLADSKTLLPVNRFEQKMELRKLPYFWGKFDHFGANKNTKILQDVLNTQAKIKPNTKIELKLIDNFDKIKGNYIHMKIKSSKSGIITIQHGTDNNSSINFEIIPSDKFEDYIIRISTLYSWYDKKYPQLILINSSTDVVIDKMYLRSGD